MKKVCIHCLIKNCPIIKHFFANQKSLGRPDPDLTKFGSATLLIVVSVNCQIFHKRNLLITAYLIII